MNDLRKVALERRSVELKNATPEGRETILADIDRDVRREMQKRAAKLGHQNVIY